ncbi:HotDog domain-containing protein [Scenedesmus sp. NREL 46B-D3]|nr:HotDog domain-containing protein [Scenedesmus sp. NREL 46B-D3]
MHRPPVISRTTAAAAAATPRAAAHQPLAPDVMHIEQSHGHWHHGVHYVVMEVRDYELDQFQVVNNATYASYVQHGRHKALASLGIPVEQFQQQGTLMALSALSLSYKAPLRAGDTFYVTTAIAQVSAARVVIDHTVQQVTGHQGGQDKPVVACQATATVVFLDENYKPVRVPGDVKQVFSRLTAEYTAPEQ